MVLSWGAVLSFGGDQLYPSALSSGRRWEPLPPLQVWIHKTLLVIQVLLVLAVIFLFLFFEFFHFNWLSASWQQDPYLHVWRKVSDHCSAFSMGLLQGPDEAMLRKVPLVTKVLVTMWTTFRSFIYWCCPPSIPSRGPLTAWQSAPCCPAKHFCVGFNVFPTDASFPPHKKWPTFPLDWIPTVSSYRLSGIIPQLHTLPLLYFSRSASLFLLHLPTSHPPLSKHTPTSLLLIYTFPFLSMRIKFYWTIYEGLLVVFSPNLLTFYSHYVCHITFEKYCCLDTTHQFKRYKLDNGPALEKPERETGRHHFCTKRSGYNDASIKCCETRRGSSIFALGLVMDSPKGVLLFCLGGDLFTSGRSKEEKCQAQKSL